MAARVPRARARADSWLVREKKTWGGGPRGVFEKPEKREKRNPFLRIGDGKRCDSAAEIKYLKARVAITDMKDGFAQAPEGRDSSTPRRKASAMWSG